MFPKFVYNRRKKINGQWFYQMLAIGGHGVSSVWVDEMTRKEMTHLQD